MIEQGTGSPAPKALHVAWPLRLSAGGLAVVEQDTLDDVTQCVSVLLHTQVGARVLEPDFGIEDPTFSDGLDVDEVVEAAADYEPRAAIDVIDLVDDGTGQSVTRLSVDLA